MKYKIILTLLLVFGLGGIALAASQVADSFNNTDKIASSNQLTVDTGAGEVSLQAWSCGDNIVDARDDTTYATVLIGSQCWLAENMNIGSRVNGSSEQTDNGTIEKYCYDDNEGNCTNNGGLYQWGEAMAYAGSCNGTGEGSEACSTPVQGICPSGWHIPSHYEFVALEREVCTSGSCASDFPYDSSTTGWRGTDEGTKLKENGSSGFEGLLAGNRYADGSFNDLGSGGNFWSSLESGSSAWRRTLNSGQDGVHRNTFSQAFGFSVRCLKD